MTLSWEERHSKKYRLYNHSLKVKHFLYYLVSWIQMKVVIRMECWHLLLSWVFCGDMLLYLQSLCHLLQTELLLEHHIKCMYHILHSYLILIFYSSNEVIQGQELTMYFWLIPYLHFSLLCSIDQVRRIELLLHWILIKQFIGLLASLIIFSLRNLTGNLPWFF